MTSFLYKPVLGPAALLGLLLLSGCGGGTTLSESTIGAEVQPSSVVLDAGSTQAFSVNLSSPTWSVNGIKGGNATLGTISSGGIYTAPLGAPSPNLVIVTASSSSGSATQGEASVQIINPAPLVTSLSTYGIVAGSSDTSVAVSGSGFTPQTTGMSGSTPLATSFVNPGSISVTVPAALVLQPALVSIVVSTPAPGGGQSSPLDITVVSTGQVSATNNLLVAQYSITSPRDATMSVEFGPDTNYGLKTWSQPVPTGGGTINMLVAGMKSATTYHMRAILAFPDGSQFMDSDKTFTTGTMAAASIPQVTVTNPSGLMPSPGVIMGHLIRSGRPLHPADHSRL